MVIHPVGTLWFFGIITLHSQWNMTGQFFAERYMYLPLVGLCVVIGTALQPYPWLVAAVAAYLTYRTHKFIPVWRNQQELWRNDVASFPENPQSHNNLAQFYMNIRDEKMPVYRINEIAMLLQKTQFMEPTSWEVHMNLACFTVMTGDLQAGYDFTVKAIELLEPLTGGEPNVPLQRLKEQEGKLKAKLEEMKQNGAA